MSVVSANKALIAHARPELRVIAGVLNGTCNYVLDRCAEALLLNTAVREAQELNGIAVGQASRDCWIR